MSVPVIVIHGVNVHDRKAFEQDVEVLNRNLGDEWELVPVFWADLAANVRLIDAVVPSIGVRSEEGGGDREISSLAATLLSGTMPEQSEGVRSGAQAAEIVADAAAAEVSVRSASSREVRNAIEDEWQNEEWLRLVRDEQALRQIGRAIADAVAEEEEDFVEVRGGQKLRRAVRRVMDAMNEAMGAAISLSAGNLHQYLRRLLGPHIGRFLGDIFVYESRRDAIQERLRERVRELGDGWGTAGRPVSVLAHSLGGLITFDSAVREDDPLHIADFVTFGSQPAFFHIINSRYEVPPFSGTRVRIGSRIRRWLNVWQPLDPLAFIAGAVFELEDGVPPRDLMLAHRGSDPLWTHSVYWTSSIFASDVRDFLLDSAGV